MTSKEFLIKSKGLDTHVISVLHQKVRLLFKCYTVFEFHMGEDKIFTFKKSHKINGIRMNDPKTYRATYTLVPFDESRSKLTITTF